MDNDKSWIIMDNIGLPSSKQTCLESHRTTRGEIFEEARFDAEWIGMVFTDIHPLVI